MSLRSLFALTVCASIGAGADAADDFVDLFNGKDFDGWVNVNGAEETWSVRDGVIHCTGKPICALRTERQYENFVLELEWRHLKPGGNAGVFIWGSALAAPGQPFLRAIEVQVLDHAYGKSDWFTTHGDVFPIHGSRMKPFGPHRGMRSFPSEERSKGSPEWNHYRIECDAGTLRLHVNGKEVSGGGDCVWRKGYIALESEGSPVEFRNIRIKELATTDLEDGMAAPEETGFANLYSGIDLRGWKPAEGWEGADWQLKGDAGAILWSERMLGEGELIVDAKAAEGVELGVLIKGRDEAGLRWTANGKWQRKRISLARGEAVLRDQAGEVEAKSELGDAGKDGRAVGLSAEAAASFANLYFRPAS